MCIDATRRHRHTEFGDFEFGAKNEVSNRFDRLGAHKTCIGGTRLYKCTLLWCGNAPDARKPRFFAAGSKQNSPFRSWKHGCARLFPHTTARLRNAARRAVGWVRLRYFTHDLKGTVSTHLRIGVPITVSSILCGVLRRVTSPR